jgi:hypothetical protein
VQYRFTGEGLTAGKEFVNTGDTNHPVMCNFIPYDLIIGKPNITFEGCREWTIVGNFFIVDRYPANGLYSNNNLTLVSYCLDQLKTIAGDGVPMMIVQGCGLGE